MQIQAPGSIMMIRPSNFGYNPLTAHSNAFQVQDTRDDPMEISHAAQKEFDHFHELFFLYIQNLLQGLTGIHMLPEM